MIGLNSLNIENKSWTGFVSFLWIEQHLPPGGTAASLYASNMIRQHTHQNIVKLNEQSCCTLEN